jgi:hypothetical protein
MPRRRSGASARPLAPDCRRRARRDVHETDAPGGSGAADVLSRALPRRERIPSARGVRRGRPSVPAGGERRPAPRQRRAAVAILAVRDASAALRSGSLRAAIESADDGRDRGARQCRGTAPPGDGLLGRRTLRDQRRALPKGGGASPRDERARLASPRCSANAGRSRRGGAVLLDTSTSFRSRARPGIASAGCIHAREHTRRTGGASSARRRWGRSAASTPCYQVIGQVQALQQNGDGRRGLPRRVAVNPNDPAAHRALATRARRGPLRRRA